MAGEGRGWVLGTLGLSPGAGAGSVAGAGAGTVAGAGMSGVDSGLVLSSPSAGRGKDRFIFSAGTGGVSSVGGLVLGTLGERAGAVRAGLFGPLLSLPFPWSLPFPLP